jgi:hypothetical protein
MVNVPSCIPRHFVYYLAKGNPAAGGVIRFMYIEEQIPLVEKKVTTA